MGYIAVPPWWHLVPPAIRVNQCHTNHFCLSLFLCLYFWSACGEAKSRVLKPHQSSQTEHCTLSNIRTALTGITGVIAELFSGLKTLFSLSFFHASIVRNGLAPGPSDWSLMLLQVDAPLLGNSKAVVTPLLFQFIHKKICSSMRRACMALRMFITLWSFVLTARIK